MATASVQTREGFDAVPATPEVRHQPRRRDRRRALGALLAALTRSLDRQLDISLMRGEFEDALRRLVPVRSVLLRDTGSRWAGRIEDAGALESGALESIVLDVAGADPAMPGQLEATFEPGCCLGEWDFQTLNAAAHVAALVLEIERLRVQLVRAGLLQTARMRRDAASPLIGSTPVMDQLRATIERV